MVIDLDRCHSRANGTDDARALVAQNGWKDAFAVEPVQRIGVGVANACRHDLDQDFTLFRAFQIKLDNLKRFLRLKGDGGTGFHGGSPCWLASLKPQDGGAEKPSHPLWRPTPSPIPGDPWP